MGCNYPMLGSFIINMEKIQLRNINYNQLEVERSPPKELKRYFDTDKRLIKIVQEYNNPDILSYLKGISLNISLK